MTSGILGIGMAIFMFISPQTMISIWPWTLSPLNARILGGWFGLLGVGGLYASQDSRWSAWCMPMQSITFWGALILIGAFVNPQDFTNGLWNPFTIGTLVVVALLFVFQVGMELQRKKMV